MRVSDVSIQRSRVLEHKAARGACDPILLLTVAALCMELQFVRALESFAAALRGAAVPTPFSKELLSASLKLTCERHGLSILKVQLPIGPF